MAIGFPQETLNSFRCLFWTTGMVNKINTNKQKSKSKQSNLSSFFQILVEKHLFFFHQNLQSQFINMSRL